MVPEHVRLLNRHTSGNVRTHLGGWVKIRIPHTCLPWFNGDSVLPNPMNVHDGFTRFTS